jgi:hypothetical protein
MQLLVPGFFSALMAVQKLLFKLAVLFRMLQLSIVVYL